VQAYVITLEGHAYSERKAAECVLSGQRYGVTVERFKAVPAADAVRRMENYGLVWSWAKGNTARAVCPRTGLHQMPYGNLAAKIGCSLSHWLLWRRCVELAQPILILEHDAEFIGPVPDLDVTCQINDPQGATHKGQWWSAQIAKKGPGVHDKTRVMDDPQRPDGLAGNSAYVIAPKDADKAVGLFYDLGIWPNDATLCIQLFPGLKELYPFAVKTKQEQSTTCV
jgi:hypothetical protein